MAKSKNNVTYGSEKLGYQLSFDDFKGVLGTLTKIDRSLYQEAIDRFSSMLIKALEKRDSLDQTMGTPNHGINELIALLKSVEKDRPQW
jgi:hypothetical protein